MTTANHGRLLPRTITSTRRPAVARTSSSSVQPQPPLSRPGHPPPLTQPPNPPPHRYYHPDPSEDSEDDEEDGLEAMLGEEGQKKKRAVPSPVPAQRGKRLGVLLMGGGPAGHEQRIELRRAQLANKVGAAWESVGLGGGLAVRRFGLSAYDFPVVCVTPPPHLSARSSRRFKRTRRGWGSRSRSSADANATCEPL